MSGAADLIWAEQTGASTPQPRGSLQQIPMFPSAGQSRSASSVHGAGEAIADPPPIPTETEFVVHLQRPIPGESLEWHDIIPVVIRNTSEMHAAALLCAESNVVGAFLPCRLQVTVDRTYLLLTIDRSGSSIHSASASKQFISIADITDVGRLLPRSFGVEAVGNPMSGSRLTIKCRDRVIVLYALTQGQQMRWFDYLMWRVELQRPQNRIPRTVGAAGVADPVFGGLSPAAKPPDLQRVDVAPPPLQAPRFGATAAAPSRAGVAASMMSLLPPSDFELWKVPQRYSPADITAQVSSILSADIAPPMSSFELHAAVADDTTVLARAAPFGSPAAAAAAVALASVNRRSDEAASPRRATAYDTAFLPVEFEESGPSDAHLKWRFGDLLKHMEPEAPGGIPPDPAALELVRKLRNLVAIGTWCEVGQAEPLDAEGDASSGEATAGSSSGPSSAALPAAAAAASSSGKYSALRMDGRIKTAADVLGRRDHSVVSAEAGGGGATAADGVPPLWAGGTPWIAMDHRMSHEAQMAVLWRLAHLHVAPQDYELPHDPLPLHLRASEVREYWLRRYEDARGQIKGRAATLRDRLGLVRAARRRDGERRRVDVAQLLPKSASDNDPLGLARMPPAPKPAEREAPKPAAAEPKKDAGIAKQVGSFVKFLM